MNVIQAKQAIRQRYMDQVTNGTQPVPFVTQFDNQPLTNSDGLTIEKPTTTPWVRFSINMTDARQAQTAGTFSNTHRHLGLAIAQVFIPVDKGDVVGWSIAMFIADAFRTVDASGVNFQTPGHRVIGRTESWWQINTICPFRFDQIA